MSLTPYLRLYINVDHVATIRQARRTDEPDPVLAAAECERAGADGITAHLREDRRHIQDHDVARLAKSITTVFNLEIAATEEMIRVATAIRPLQVTLVPERRDEVTTEGGLDVSKDPAMLRHAIDRLRKAGIRTSLFIDANETAVRRSQEVGADAIELHTGPYAHRPRDTSQITALRNAAALASSLKLSVHAGHGLTATNVHAVAGIQEIEELNVGHSIVSRAVFVGLAAAVHEMRVAMLTARASSEGV